MRCSRAELGIAGATTDEVAWRAKGDATELVASLGAEGRSVEPLRMPLRVLLLGAAWFELGRRREQLPLEASSVAALARQAADVAYTDLLARLGDYRGQSRFHDLGGEVRNSPCSSGRPARCRVAACEPPRTGVAGPAGLQST